MDKNEAIQHALGYACGREDASKVPTVTATDHADGVGWLQFAEAYATAWDEFNSGARFYMTNARSAYEAWQATAGESIFSDPRDRTDAMIARRAGGQ